MSTAAAPAAAEHDYLFKLLLIGNSGVGKSNILLRFADEIYKEDLDATIGVDFKICTSTICDSRIKMQIWDTAGQERFRTITASYYRGSHGIIVAYDITDRTSFEHVRMWMQEIEKYVKADVTRLLVGNKCDLASKRCVTYDEGKDFADDLGVGFVEASARDGRNVDEAFVSLCRDILARVAPERSLAPASATRLSPMGVPTALGGGMCCGA